MTSLEKDCDRLLQIVVVERDKVCQRPGCNNPATAGHHVFGRSAMGTRYVPDACLGLCVEDHDGWARTDRMYVLNVLCIKIGVKRFREIGEMSKKVCRFRAAEFREIRQQLRMMIKGVGVGR